MKNLMVYLMPRWILACILIAGVYLFSSVLNGNQALYGLLLRVSDYVLSTGMVLIAGPSVVLLLSATCHREIRSVARLIIFWMINIILSVYVLSQSTQESLSFSSLYLNSFLAILALFVAVFLVLLYVYDYVRVDFYLNRDWPILFLLLALGAILSLVFLNLVLKVIGSAVDNSILITLTEFAKRLILVSVLGAIYKYYHSRMNSKLKQSYIIVGCICLVAAFMSKNSLANSSYASLFLNQLMNVLGFFLVIISLLRILVNYWVQSFLEFFDDGIWPAHLILIFSLVFLFIVSSLFGALSLSFIAERLFFGAIVLVLPQLILVKYNNNINLKTPTINIANAFLVCGFFVSAMCCVYLNFVGASLVFILGDVYRVLFGFLIAGMFLSAIGVLTALWNYILQEYI